MILSKYTIASVFIIFLWLLYQIYDLNQRLAATEKVSRVQSIASKIVLYNRIPKTGSTTFANIVDKLAERNRFWNININTSLASGGYGNNYIWPLSQQRDFLNNITSWTRYQPAIYHGHFGVIPIEKFLVRKQEFLK